MRDFEFISLSADDPKDTTKVKEFLEKRGAGLSERLKKSVKDEGRKTNSYLFTGASTETLMKTLDPQWAGGIPHTVLVGTDGEIIWRHNGPVSGEELRANLHHASDVKQATLKRLANLPEEYCRRELAELDIEPGWKPIVDSCLAVTRKIVKSIPD